MRKYMFVDASFWQSSYTLEAIKLLKDNGMNAMVLRGGYADVEDTFLATLVSYCRTLGIPFGLYWYLYPGVGYQVQIDKFVSVINKYPDATCAVLDFEEYKTFSLNYRFSVLVDNGGRLGSNYESHLDSFYKSGLAVGIVPNLSANYSSTYLSTFYKTSHDALKTALPNMKIADYSAKWCIDGYFPQVSSWLKPSFYWNAAYVKYYTWYQDFMQSLGASWGDSTNLISISNLPAILAEVEAHWNEQPLPTGIPGCMAWQFNSFFPFIELTKGQRNIDMNLAPASTFKEYFNLELEGGEPLPPVIIEGKALNMVGVSQIGVGANDHHNDCGLACCSMDVLAAKDIFVPVDEWYKMDGWGAPSLDVGTTAYQLQKAMALFDVRTTSGSALSIANIQGYISKGLPIITLVDYGVLSDAGLTYYKGDFLHWFVVMGYDSNNVIVLDPYRPYDIGLKIIIPNQIFLNSYKGSYVALVDSIEGGIIPMGYNGTVNAASLNVRSSPPINGIMGNIVGALVLNNRVTIDRNTITADNWGNVIASDNIKNPIGWASMTYIKLDPLTPTPPPTLDESAIRKDELSKAKAAFDAYYTKRNAEL